MTRSESAARRISSVADNFDTSPKEASQSHLNRVTEYINRHYPEDLSLEKLAAVAHFSKYHFHRLFHEYFKETVHDYVRRVRLEHAARLLTTDLNASIAQIAETCGFSSSQNFARAFKAHFGVSPTSARNNPDRHITGIAEDRKDGDPDQAPLNVEIQELPSYRVAYIRDVGPYWSESNRDAFLRLMQWAVAAGAATDPSAIPIAVGWSDPATTSPDDCIFDACIPVSVNIKGDGEIRIQHLPGGAFAILRCECSWERLFWESNRLFYEWLPLSGFRRDKRPFFFKCYNNPDMNPRKLAIVDVCLPIKL